MQRIVLYSLSLIGTNFFTHVVPIFYILFFTFSDSLYFWMVHATAMVIF
jgi:hypothetical protein